MESEVSSEGVLRGLDEASSAHWLYDAWAYGRRGLSRELYASTVDTDQRLRDKH